MTRTALVTGATGFIGAVVARRLRDEGWAVRAVVRDPSRVAALPPGVEPLVWDLAAQEAPAGALAGVQAVIHLAARAHRLGEDEGAALALYRAANVDATRRLLHAARDAGVARFVHVSSIKVLGEATHALLGEQSPVAPIGSYAVTKADAEALVRREAGTMAWTVVRPVFVYGAGGKGNFPRLVWLARLATRLPLPLASLHNRRSILYVENLASLLVHCATTPDTAGMTINAADTPALSTPELLRAMARVWGRRARLVPVPPRLLGLLLRALGRGGDWDRLAGALEVDTAPLRRLGWRAPYDLDAALRHALREGGAPRA